jgi:hypothetical protein
MAYEPRERRAPTARPNSLPAQLRAGLESMSGHDLSGVQVHTNSALPASVGALAYTQGQNIHLAPGQEHHLPHESWHAVQQLDGRVKPTIDVNGAAVNDDAALESEAETMGRKAQETGTHTLQRVVEDEEENLKKT